MEHVLLLLQVCGTLLQCANPSLWGRWWAWTTDSIMKCFKNRAAKEDENVIGGRRNMFHPPTSLLRPLLLRICSLSFPAPAPPNPPRACSLSSSSFHRIVSYHASPLISLQLLPPTHPSLNQARPSSHPSPLPGLIPPAVEAASRDFNPSTPPTPSTPSSHQILIG